MTCEPPRCTNRPPLALAGPRAQRRFLEAEPEPHTKWAVTNEMLMLNNDNSVAVSAGNNV